MRLDTTDAKVGTTAGSLHADSSLLPSTHHLCLSGSQLQTDCQSPRTTLPLLGARYALEHDSAREAEGEPRERDSHWGKASLALGPCMSKQISQCHVESVALKGLGWLEPLDRNHFPKDG